MGPGLGGTCTLRLGLSQGLWRGVNKPRWFRYFGLGGASQPRPEGGTRGWRQRGVGAQELLLLTPQNTPHPGPAGQSSALVPKPCPGGAAHPRPRTWGWPCWTPSGWTTSSQVCPPKTSLGLFCFIAHHPVISPGHGEPQHLLPGGFGGSLCGDVAGAERVHLGLMKHPVWRDMGDVAHTEGLGGGPSRHSCSHPNSRCSWRQQG